MKIVHVITTLDLGGAEKQLLTLVEFQIKLGHKVYVVPIKGKRELGSRFESVGAEVITTLINQSFFVQALSLKIILGRLQPDVLHAHLPRAELLCGIVSTSNLCFGITRHNTENFIPGFPASTSSFLSRWVLKRTKFQIAISEAVRKFCIENNECNMNTSFQTIYYGLNFHDLSTVEIREVDKLQGVVVARFVEQKNHVFLFKAIALLEPNNRPDFLLIGRGELENELRRLAESLDIEGSLRWIGVTPVVEEFMKESDFLCLCSNYEGFGLVLLEAMSMCLPVIAPSIPVIEEVLGHNYPGLYQPNDEEDFLRVVMSLRDLNHRKTLSDCLRQRRYSFSAEKTALDTLSVYRNSI